MKYILMMNARGGSPYTISNWPEQDVKAHIGFMIGFGRKLRESGELVSAEGLAGPEEAKLVRAGKDGRPITDGVFPEAKEFLAGYWIVEVDTPERAYRDRRGGIRCAGTGRRAAQHADRSAAGHERTATRDAVTQRRLTRYRLARHRPPQRRPQRRRPRRGPPPGSIG